jgi:hypothetical protein
VLHLILRPALLVFVACAAAFGLAAATAQTPPDPLIAQVLREGCEGVAQPCWFGIVPGETGFQEAIDRLYEHPWIGAIDVSEMPSPYVSWLWSEDAPTAIRGEGAPAGGYVWVGYPEYHRVEGVHLWTALPQGAYWLALGRPDEAGDAVGAIGYAAGYPAQRGRDRVLAAAFAGGTLVLHSGFPCQASAHQFFNAPAAISVYVQSPRTLGDLTDGGLSDWLYRAPCDG